MMMMMGRKHTGKREKIRKERGMIDGEKERKEVHRSRLVTKE